MIVSHNASTPIERIAQGATGPLWWQLYPYPPQSLEISREERLSARQRHPEGACARANAVLLGRATRWALGAFGAPGVQRLLEIVQQELVNATAAAGRATLASIDRRTVKTNFV